MPILEVLQVRLKPNISATDPSLLANLSEVRSKISTNSRFYQCIEDPTLIYILGEWASLSAHKDFLTSPQRSEILAKQETQLDFNWMVHLPFSGMSALPLDAPVMAIARLFIKSGDNHPKMFEDLVDKHRHLIFEGTKPWGVVDGWRCDGEEGTFECLMFTGWKSVEGHDEFRMKTRRDVPEYAAIKDHYEGMEVRHARDLEKLVG